MEDLSKIKMEIVHIEDDDEVGAPRMRTRPRRSRRARRASIRPENDPVVVAGSSESTPSKNKKGNKKINDLRGLHIASGMDICDCLEEGCPGCHFPCRKCRSPKCGVECRSNRKTPIDCVVIEGTGCTLINKYKD